MSPTLNRPAQLHLVRIALLAGVLLFGGVCWYTQRAPGWTPASPEALRNFANIVRAAWAIAFLGLVLLYVLAQRRKGPSDGTYEQIGWALGEATALAGAVYYYQSGDPQRYLWGVAGLLLTFVIFPAPPRST